MLIFCPPPENTHIDLCIETLSIPSQVHVQLNNWHMCISAVMFSMHCVTMLFHKTCFVEQKEMGNTALFGAFTYMCMGQNDLNELVYLWNNTVAALKDYRQTTESGKVWCVAFLCRYLWREQIYHTEQDCGPEKRHLVYLVSPHLIPYQ